MLVIKWKQMNMAGKWTSEKWKDEQRWQQSGSWSSQTNARKEREAKHEDELHIVEKVLQQKKALLERKKEGRHILDHDRELQKGLRADA